MTQTELPRLHGPCCVAAVNISSSWQDVAITISLDMLVPAGSTCKFQSSCTMAIKSKVACLSIHVESDTSYQSKTKSRSRVAGYHYLGPKPNPALSDTDEAPDIPANGPITVISSILNVIVSSAAEAKTAALYYNCREAYAIRTCLEEMGHPQPATPVVTENSTAAGIANDNIKRRCSKAMDMRFYWVRDRVRQKQFKIHWKKGSLNHADYFSKHHPTSHHCAVRSTFLYDPTNPIRNHFAILQDADNADGTKNGCAIPVGGCADLPGLPRVPTSTGIAPAEPSSADPTVPSLQNSLILSKQRCYHLSAKTTMQILSTLLCKLLEWNSPSIIQPTPLLQPPLQQQQQQHLPLRAPPPKLASWQSDFAVKQHLQQCVATTRCAHLGVAQSLCNKAAQQRKQVLLLVQDAVATATAFASTDAVAMASTQGNNNDNRHDKSCLVCQVVNTAAYSFVLDQCFCRILQDSLLRLRIHQPTHHQGSRFDSPTRCTMWQTCRHNIQHSPVDQCWKAIKAASRSTYHTRCQVTCNQKQQLPPPPPPRFVPKMEECNRTSGNGFKKRQA